MTALARPPDGADRGAGAGDAFADGATVLVGDPGDPVVFLAAAASRIDAGRLARLQDLAGCAAVLGVAPAHARRLALAPLSAHPGELGLHACTPIDAAAGLRGGWSLRDRAATMRTAAAVGTEPGDLAVPGHVAPARIGERATPAAAAALELSRRAGRTTAVVLAPVGDRDGTPVTLADVDRDGAGALRGLPRASSTQLRADAIRAAAHGRTVDCALPTRAGSFRAIVLDGGDASGAGPGCLALVHGDPAGRARPLVRVHVACTPGETLFASTCDCRARLDAALAEVVAAGAGAVVYVRPAGGDPLRCARRSATDLAPALALLRTCGIDAAAVLPT